MNIDNLCLAFELEDSFTDEILHVIIRHNWRDTIRRRYAFNKFRKDIYL